MLFSNHLYVFVICELAQLNHFCSCYLQPDRVTEFCKKNKLQLIIRAHECVMDGFERFAQGQLITLFSATNYCGK
jgi:diadenosine tetraphosphatase ApaH/serine/threonine PP2A family protein phosphatase